MEKRGLWTNINCSHLLSLSCLFGRGFDPILEGAMHACGRTLLGIGCSRG